MRKPKNVYEDTYNKKIFFNLKKYLRIINKDILKQNSNGSYMIQREICIGKIWDEEKEKIIEIIKKNPNIKKIYKVERNKSNGYNVSVWTQWLSSRDEIKFKTFDFNKLSIKEYKILRR